MDNIWYNSLDSKQKKAVISTFLMVVLDGMLLENAVIGDSEVLYPDGMPVYGESNVWKRP